MNGMFGMGMYRYVSDMWKSNLELNAYLRSQSIRWRREPSIVRVASPTRLDKARMLGYKSKPGYVVARVRVRRGGARKQRPVSGRRQKALGVIKFTRAKNLKQIAEERVARKFRNLIILNSYYLWEDGRNKWFEIVMVDPTRVSL